MSHIKTVLLKTESVTEWCVMFMDTCKVLQSSVSYIITGFLNIKCPLYICMSMQTNRFLQSGQASNPAPLKHLDSWRPSIFPPFAPSSEESFLAWKVILSRGCEEMFYLTARNPCLFWSGFVVFHTAWVRVCPFWKHWLWTKQCLLSKSKDWTLVLRRVYCHTCLGNMIKWGDLFVPSPA